jgi:two-component system OmpR family response regulator
VSDESLSNVKGPASLDGRGASASALHKPGRRVLVCEDDPSIREMLSTLLTRERFEVVTASNGTEAISRLDDSYEVIILDLMMPNTNGYDVLNHLRERNPALIERVIVVTARAEVRRKALTLPVAQTLIKPFDLDEFMGAVRRVAGDR